MLRFAVRATFPASHRIRIDTRGTLEPTHEHEWRVRAWMELRSDREAGPIVDRARRALESWVDRYRGRCLNRVEPFDRINPTAEEVARSVSRTLADGVREARVVRVEIGEAPGFSAVYWPRGPLDDEPPQSGS